MSYDPAAYWPERYARQGAAYVAKGGRPASFEDQLERVAPLFELLPSRGRVLDFGCGPGRFRPALEARGLDYEGFDIIPALGTVDAVEPARYDCAVAIYVLQHIVETREYAQAAALIQGALVPGGVLLVVDSEVRERHPPHMRPRGPSALATWLELEHHRSFDAGHWLGVFRR